MKSIFTLIEKLKGILPYLMLIAVYFFFINLEARKKNNEMFIIEEIDNSINNKSSLNDKNIRLNIPVIPYER